MVVHNCVIVIEFSGIARTDIWTTTKKTRCKNTFKNHMLRPAYHIRMLGKSKCVITNLIGVLTNILDKATCTLIYRN